MSQIAFRRAQVYHFLAGAFLYPQDNWLEDLPVVAGILDELEVLQGWFIGHASQDFSLPALQSEHRRTFGLTGSQCYETEFGLPHEFRQSQELADIAGFYQAFGFKVGGIVRERPDHLAVELEFMYVLALKEAYAVAHARQEQTEICRDAQGKFLGDHIGRWIGLFAESLTRSTPGGPYLALAQFAAAFVNADAKLLGLRLEKPQLVGIGLTPLGPDLSCEDCLVPENLR